MSLPKSPPEMGAIAATRSECSATAWTIQASVQESRTLPARVMSGIQFFEALIGDQLLPTQAYVDLLNEQGFTGVDAFDLTPVHAVTYGRKH